MRTISILIALLVPALAAAQPAAPAPVRLDPAKLPQSCQQFAAPAPTARLQLAARISLANCLASERLDALQLGNDPERSRRQLTEAIAPSVALLDQVIAQGDPSARIMAQHAKGDLYIGLVVRLRNTVPPVPAGSSNQQHLAYLQREIEPRTYDWLARADRAFGDVRDVANANPAIVDDPVVGNVIANSVMLKAQTGTIVGRR